jgi:PQQ-dependent dehydrogenase (methanol/ethanol family)
MFMNLVIATLIPLYCVQGLYAQGERPESQVNRFAGNRQAIEAGQTLYSRNCSVCHGPAAQGDRGPSLVSGVFPHGGADGEIFLSIRAGIQGTQMPSFTQLSNDQIWQVIAYLRDLSGIAAPAGSAANEKVPGDPAAGKAVFEGQGGCLGCHVVGSAGKAVGPDLSDAARIPAQQLRAKILNPNQPPAGGRGGGRGGPPPPATVVVTTPDGREYRGARKNADSFDIALIDTNGDYRSFNKSAAGQVQIENQSLMPADYGQRLSPGEIQDVVAYLKTLTGGDPSKRATGTKILSWDRLVNSGKEPQNYMTYWGDLTGKHYSPLGQINAGNVKNLQAKWALPLTGNGSTEAIPLVVDGIMYTIGPVAGSLEVLALDARTGRVLWRYQRKQKVTNPNEINRSNRGVAVAGDRLFFGTLDAFLIALDARTGAQLWETKVADTMQGYSITAPPLPVKDKIVTGIGGGEFGISGFLEAYDQATGKKVWRFNTTPQPGEAGHETWDGDSWKRGGAPTWLPGSFDADLNLLYWGVGNPGPDYNGDVRKGDNLYSCSVIALDPDTGTLKWHYQFTPNDTHDWDSTEDMVLVDRVWHGLNRKLLLHADRNGVFYVLDRTTGKFLAGNPFVRATWVKGWDENGRPITTGNWRSDEKGETIYPAVGGGTNFQAPSYSLQTGWMYFMYHDGPENYVSGPTPFEPGAQYNGRGTRRGGAISAGEAPPSDGIQAFDPETGKTQWKFELAQGGLAPGLLSTAGGVVFAATSEGNFLALDAKTGKALWHFTTGVRMASSPMSYAVDGKQFVAISSSGILYSFGLPE